MGASLLFLILILYITAQVQLFTSFSELEEETAQKDVERVLNAVSSELASLEDLAQYWAARNDTYAFLQTEDVSFIDNNLDSGALADDSLRNMGINLLIFMDSFGHIAFSRYLDEYENTAKSPQDLSEQLSLYGFCPGCLDKQSKYSGIILLSGCPMLTVTSPVTRSTGDGDSVGRVVLGRYLTDKEVSRLSMITQLHITVHSLRDDELPRDFQEAVPHLSDNRSILINLLNKNSIAGYAMLNNIYGNPLLILRVDSPREIYMQGMKSLQSFLILFSAAGFLLFLFTLLYLDRSVLSRLSFITDGVARIGKSRNMTARLVIRGSDELSGLALSINNMLTALERAHDDLISSEKRYKAVVEEQSDLILRNLYDGTITFVNSIFCDFFSRCEEEIIGSKIENLVPPEQLDPAVSQIRNLSASSPTTTYECLFSRPEGRRWILWTSHGIFDEDGSLIEIQSVGRDITDLKMAEDALKQSERRMADIIDFMPDALLAIDIEGKVIVWNKAMESLTGVRALNMVGKGNYEYSLPFYGFRRPILVDMMLRPFKEFEAEYISLKKEGDAIEGETFIPGMGSSGSYLMAKAALLYNAAGDSAGAIESIRDMTERRIIEQKLERTKAELHIAAEIQKSFIPRETPHIPEFEIEAATIPAMEVGGDFYDFILQPDGKYGLVIADVAGKSIPAALFMALSRTIIRANAANQPGASSVMEKANRMIAADASAGMFVTALYGVLDGKSLSIRYANAGHLPPLLFRSDGCQFEEGTARGIALGVLESAEYEEGYFALSPGDIVVFYTDGVTEAVNRDGEMYGSKRLLDLIGMNHRDSSKDILKGLLADILGFGQGCSQHDDITLIVIKALG